MTRALVLLIVLSGAACSPAASSTDDGGDALDDGGHVIRGRGVPDGGDVDMDPAAPDMCRLYTHSDGFDWTVAETWIDCVPKSTYNQAQAMAACETFKSFHPDVAALTCTPITCPAGDHGGDAVALNYGLLPVCDVHGCTTQECGVWTYSGMGAGAVGDYNINCGCPVYDSTTRWN